MLDTLESVEEFRDSSISAAAITINVSGLLTPAVEQPPEPHSGRALPVVRTKVHPTCDRRIGSEVLLYGTPATVLDRGAALDDAGDRGGPGLSVDCLKASHTSVHAA